jgi:hypothetical protein
MSSKLATEFMGHGRGANVGEPRADQHTVVTFAGIHDGTPQLAVSCTWWRTGWCVSLAPSNASSGCQPNCSTGMPQTLETRLVHFLPNQFSVQAVVGFKVNSEHDGYFVMRYVNVNTDVNTR